METNSESSETQVNDDMPSRGRWRVGSGGTKDQFAAKTFW